MRARAPNFLIFTHTHTQTHLPAPTALPSPKHTRATHHCHHPPCGPPPWPSWAAGACPNRCPFFGPHRSRWYPNARPLTPPHPPSASASSLPPASAGSTEGRQARFSPYEFNGGTALGIAGANFAVVAADTRLSRDYNILSRDVSKGKVLTPGCVIATGGCFTDVATLHKVLGMKAETYKQEHDADMSTTAAAQLLGNTLY